MNTTYHGEATIRLMFRLDTTEGRELEDVIQEIHQCIETQLDRWYDKWSTHLALIDLSQVLDSLTIYED